MNQVPTAMPSGNLTRNISTPGQQEIKMSTEGYVEYKPTTSSEGAYEGIAGEGESKEKVQQADDCYEKIHGSKYSIHLVGADDGNEDEGAYINDSVITKRATSKI